ncbi:MAG: hypothetical protein DMF84_25370 [Acidobacteria bacterium]|nr:MAG: hypothetical protein DMF84_25370 [Acidobacteriota bacterium]
MSKEPSLNIGQWTVGIALFMVLCTMNSAGYRYGASDQAFYLPVVLRHLDASLFPRDRALIDAQGRLTLYDDLVAALARVTPLSLPHLFFALYLCTLAVLFVAALRIGAHWYRARWAPLALAAALTLRHAIAKTGANTLEGYFHPRQLAFAIALMALSMFLLRRDGRAALLLVIAAALHPTATAWFVVWLGVAVWVARPRWRRAILAVAGAGILIVTWIVVQGPLAGRLVKMDGAWLAVIADKDYLFPLSWPFNVWLTNLITIPIIVLGWRARRRAGALVERETALVVGALGLLVLFLCWLPFNAAHVALAIQLQVSRLFWLLDLLATIYLVGMLADGTARRAAVAALVLALASAARGAYICFVQFPDRPIVALDLQHRDWRDAMAWARQTPTSSGWLADPFHATRYGSSVRAAGQRDVFLEQLKDTALAMYDRDVAMRVADRERALTSVAWDSPDGARALGRRYDLDYLLVEHPIDLPLAHQAGSIFIYRLR